jgi:uncharacterized membrane protein YqjE
MEEQTVAGPESKEQSVGELLQQASQQMAELVRQEMRLAQAELKEKGKAAGIGAGLLGGSGVVALYAVAALLTAAVLLLATALAPWLAGLIVAAALGGLAAVLALRARKELEEAVPPVPQRAGETVQQDVEAVKESAKRGKQRNRRLPRRSREPTLQERMSGGSRRDR